MIPVKALIILLFTFVLTIPAFADTSNDVIDVLKGFNTEKQESNIVEIEDKTKHQIMFYMAVPLLLLLITTVILGIAMAVWGKQVFIAHMICAGLSLTLAIAHAVVGIVWFAPW